MTLRTATVADARSIAEVHDAGWRWAYRGQIPDDFIDGLSVDDREATWRRILVADDATVRIAVVGGRIVGFAAAGPPDAPDLPERTGELHAIYLRREVAGRGIGATLLTDAEDGLRTTGHTHAILWVLETNERARRFYERAGWAWDGTVSSHRFDCAARPVVRYARDL